MSDLSWSLHWVKGGGMCSLLLSALGPCLVQTCAFPMCSAPSLWEFIPVLILLIYRALLGVLHTPPGLTLFLPLLCGFSLTVRGGIWSRYLFWDCMSLYLFPYAAGERFSAGGRTRHRSMSIVDCHYFSRVVHDNIPFFNTHIHTQIHTHTFTTTPHPPHREIWCF